MSRDTTEPLIYIVDDQTMLLDLAEASLQGESYQIQKFSDPVSALDAFRDSTTKPALLITDYAMDTMNGLDLINLCKEMDPGVKTILISGTMGAEIIADSTVEIDRFLGKPYQPENLLDLVQKVLDL